MPQENVTYMQSRLGQQNFLTAARVALLFTYNREFNTDIDQQQLDFTGSIDPYSSTLVGPGYAGRGGTIPQIGGRTTGNPGELVVGAGWRSVQIRQDHNVTQENGLGHYDILETIMHSVRSNSMVCEKMALRAALLSQVGVAGFGKQVLTDPNLNCIIYDPKERQRGKNIGYLKVYGLHLETNNFNMQVGQTVMENVTFRPDRIVRHNQPVDNTVKKQLKKMYPSIYDDLEVLESSQVDRR